MDSTITLSPRLALPHPAGPMFGQFGHFTKYAPENIPYAIERYTKEAKRLLSVLETRLTGRQYLMGDEYTIAGRLGYMPCIAPCWFQHH